MFGLVFPRPTYAGNSKTAEKASEKTSEKKRLKTSEKILDLAAANPRITIAELSERIGVTTHSIERNIKNLQYQGRLSRLGPNKGGYWKVVDE